MTRNAHQSARVLSVSHVFSANWDWFCRTAMAASRKPVWRHDCDMHLRISDVALFV